LQPGEILLQPVTGFQVDSVHSMLERVAMVHLVSR
jgi:hypothetical protein